jgi:hypothetical protein
MSQTSDAERHRLSEDSRREKNWKRWGPYLSERQWGTVREDYSENGACWEYFPHDHARSRTYRWGEDGLLGICDREGRLCFALSLWNEADAILKERAFGLTNREGNHGEDLKEYYFYLDATPTHSYLKALYKYPQRAFPYRQLLEENSRRGREQPEYELLHTGIFDQSRYFDIQVEYAKHSPNDILIRVTLDNRGSESAPLHFLPTLWFRNTWSWGRHGEGYWPKPRIGLGAAPREMIADHSSLGRFRLAWDSTETEAKPLFTDNETNFQRLYGVPNQNPYVKDAFDRYLVRREHAAVNPSATGTKAALHYLLRIPAGARQTLQLRLFADSEAPAERFGQSFDQTFAERIDEADEFFAARLDAHLTDEERRISRQAYAGLLWSKQFYHYDLRTWLEGDPPNPPPPQRKHGRNADWTHLYNRDVVSVPDNWEYPWYAAWDFAFHMLPFARVDPDFAKEQLVLFLREWYMHPNGQLPAYEFGFSDVNPPVHAWAAWRVYKIAAERGSRDRHFLARVFQKLLLNFTWWVNRKDAGGKHLFSGGFLGLDNIGVFDRSRPLPGGGLLEQADGTAWMAFFCATMLSIALELARGEPAYDDMASKFFEHFVAIADAMNWMGGTGLWSESDGFYYDQLLIDGKNVPLRIRSMVGLIPLFAAEVLEDEVIDRLPHFKKRMKWFLQNRPDLGRSVAFMEGGGHGRHGHYLLAIPSRERLRRVLRYALDEREFLSPHGLRSLSQVHAREPFVLRHGQEEYRVNYEPGESNSGVFGGNSNWRGPVWFPLNYLFIEALERYHHFYGNDFRVECPTGSGQLMNLQEVARELSGRLVRIFSAKANGERPWHGDDRVFQTDPNWRGLLQFHEYFHGESGRGLGASHQTGWTALVARCLEDLARARR